MRSYQAARREARREPVEFEVAYVDEEGTEQTRRFTCHGRVSALQLSELAYNADVDADTPEGMATLREFFAAAFGDDRAYAEFRRFSARHLDDDQLMEIMSGLVEDFTGHPTEQPSVSPPTPSRTGQDSRVVSLPGGFQTQAQPVVDVNKDEVLSAVERMSASSG